MRDLTSPNNLQVPKPTFGKSTLNRLRRLVPLGNQHVVHFVYFVPSDRTARASSRVEKLAQDLQEWYRVQMGGKTFSYDVRTIQTPHTADWYSTHHDPDWAFSQWYWTNAQIELRDQCGGGFWQEFDDWVVFLDAPIAPGQSAGGTASGQGQYSGIAVLHGRDVDALMGADPEWTVCRELGGSGHEAGHSLGLPHPPTGDPHWGDAIMGTGYMIYPNCILTDANKTWLNSSPFFTTQTRKSLSDLCPFNNTGRAVPTPRPRPTPTSRPR